MQSTILIPLYAMIMLGIGAAHFWRSSMYGLSACLGCLALAAWAQWAWVRRALLVALPLLALRWLWVTAHYVHVRQLMDQPWMRLLCILAAVAMLTALAMLVVAGDKGRHCYTDSEDSADVQFGAALLIAAVLLPLQALQPWLFVLERFTPGLGGVQVACAVGWGVYLSQKLTDARQAPHIRLRAWRLFSVVFFGQLLLGIFVDARFLLTGTLHAPVPALVLGAPLYRGGGLFMLLLFGVAVLLTGAAWCSHLCYFGVWDASAAQLKKRAAPLPRWLIRMRWVMLALIIIAPLILRYCGVGGEIALALALVLGAALVPCALWWSRRSGHPVYCLGVCPLGQAAVLLGRLSPWRVMRTEKCTQCGACSHICRYDAIEMGSQGPEQNLRCTLCRDCISSCRHGGLTLCLYNKKYASYWNEKIFIILIVSLHTVFLALARV